MLSSVALAGYEVPRRTLLSSIRFRGVAEHLEVVLRGTEAVAAYRHAHPEVVLDLRGATIRGKRNLDRVDLSGALLRGADFGESRLREARLVSADLRGASLVGCDLSGARLADARMSGLDASDGELARTDMRGVDLREAVLVGTGFWGADLSHALLMDATLCFADLRLAQLAGAVLLGATARKADLRKADLSMALLTGAQLSNVQIHGAEFSMCVVYGARVSDQEDARSEMRGAIRKMTDLRTFCSRFAFPEYLAASEDDDYSPAYKIAPVSSQKFTVWNPAARAHDGEFDYYWRPGKTPTSQAVCAAHHIVCNAVDYLDTVDDIHSSRVVKFGRFDQSSESLRHEVMLRLIRALRNAELEEQRDTAAKHASESQPTRSTTGHTAFEFELPAPDENTPDRARAIRQLERELSRVHKKHGGSGLRLQQVD